MKKNVCIILPVFNESENIEKFIKSLQLQNKKIKAYKTEIIVSDSHSIDGTDKIVKSLSKKFKNIHYIDGEPGIGMGIYNGYMYALKKFKPNILVQIDADGQVDPKVLPKLIKTIEDGYDMAIGSRFVPGGKNNLAFFRKIFTWGSSFYCRTVMGPFRLREFTNSARAFSPGLIKKIKWKRIPLHNKSFITLPAQINEAILAGAKYKEVPLTFNNRDHGYSKNKITRYIYDLTTYAIMARISKLKTKHKT